MAVALSSGHHGCQKTENQDRCSEAGGEEKVRFGEQRKQLSCRKE